MAASGYSAGLVSQSFWFVEMKKMVALVKEGKTEQEIREICVTGNLFGALKEYRAKRIYRYIWNRVSGLDQNLIDLFMETDVSGQKIINLLSIMKTDRLFFEFLYEVYREKVILGTPVMEVSDGRIFFKHKEIQSAEIAGWTDETKRRLISAYLNFMTDANLLTMVQKQRTITPPILDAKLEQYLKSTENYACLKAITGEN